MKHLGLKNRPVFKKTVPMSNFDLLEWCQYLKMPIKNVLSRDETVPHNHKLSLFISNLESSYIFFKLYFIKQKKKKMLQQI